MHALRFEGLHLGAKVVAHEVQLGPGGVRGVHRSLRGRETEDEPPTSGVDVLEAEHIGEEGAIPVGVGAEHDDVGAVDHPRMLPHA